MARTIDGADATTGEGTSAASAGGVDRPAGPTVADLDRDDWLDVARSTGKAVQTGRLPLLASGVAFWALFAIVPTLVAIISVYGLVVEPTDVARQLDDYASSLPADARSLVQDQLERLAGGSSGALGIGLVVSIAVALWSASAGVRYLLSAVGAAYDEPDGRGAVAMRKASLGVTAAAIVGAVVVLGLLGALPNLFSSGPLHTAVIWVRWPVLAAGMLVFLSLVYRVGPDRRDPAWRWVTPGAVAALVVWLLASLGFSLYTSWFGRFSETYGSLAGVIVLMLWLFLTTFAVLLGAALNAELERRARAAPDG